MSRAPKKKLIAVVDSASREGDVKNVLGMAARLSRMIRAEKLNLEVLALPGIILKKNKLQPRAVEAFRHLAEYDWLIFTSRHAVHFFMEDLRTRHIQIPSAHTSCRLRIAAVGPETKNALNNLHVSVSMVPQRFSAKDLVIALSKKGRLKGTRILFPRSQAASHDVIRMLRSKGARVTPISLYAPIFRRIPRALAREVEEGKADYVLCMSPSGIDMLMKNIRDKKGLRAIPIIVIGHHTALAAHAAEFVQIHTAKTSSEAGLADLLRRLA